ncbi:MAG: hypothetical protein JWL66_2051 [Sphingomonadales bacterium]|nr:hypothetical protein [Sphingomonadales bacterium]
MKNEADLLVKHSEREALRARAQFMGTLAELRRRITPQVIVAETRERLTDRATQLIEEGKVSVGTHPVGSVVGLSALIIAVALRIWRVKAKSESDAT